MTIVAAALALATPAAAQAAQPDVQDRRQAKQECRAERGTTPATRQAFKARYGSNGLGRCVNRRAAEEQREGVRARRDAAASCRAERDADKAAFRQRYDQKGNGIGKCVSQQARQNEADADREDAERIEARQTAAAQCRTERGTTAASRAAFAQRYGTNAGRRNAFGKCVAQREREQPQA